MNRNEFEALRNLPGKQIADDIRFLPRRDNHHSLVVEKLQVANTQGWTIFLNATYKPATGSISFNFTSVEAGGPICRVDVNGTVHKDLGRTHKHDLQREEDPRNNLPHAVARADLEGKSSQEIWQDLCRRANINHTGRFFLPEQEPAA